ncbi:MAG: group II truncated hemoglobin [Candidatus Sericytochromatia bacterium]
MSIPSLYEWVGGIDALKALTKRFYEKVPSNEILNPIFKDMSPEHPEHVAKFLAEVFGGPKDYSNKHGGHPEMVRHHLNKNLTNEQRKAWLALFLDTADELKLPDDPEFRSALISYLEWGTRLAVINSQPNASVDPEATMPSWGWGEVKGPYNP